MYKRHSSSEHNADRLCVRLRDEQHKSNQNAAKTFIESTLNLKLVSNDFHKELQDGVLLCKLVNSLRPGTITSIECKNIPFVKMANISLFLQGARELGLHNSELFQTVDLYEAKDMGAVVNTILSLARLRIKVKHSSSNEEKGRRRRRTSTIDNNISSLSVPRIDKRRSSFPRLLKTVESTTATNSETIMKKEPSSLREQRSPFNSHKRKQEQQDDQQRNGYRHVKSIFGQQPNVDSTNRVTRSTDTSRISEKAEALRRTYRSNIQTSSTTTDQRPTLDSGYSTMATYKQKRRQQRNSTKMPSFDASCSSSDEEYDDDEELEETTIMDTDAKENRTSTGSTVSAMSDPISIHVAMQSEYNSYSNVTTATTTTTTMVNDNNENGDDDNNSEFSNIIVDAPYPIPSRSTPITLHVKNSQHTLHSADDANDEKRWEHLVETEQSHSDSLHPHSKQKQENTKVVLKGENGQPNTYYHLGNCIGKGQFGAVYRALDIQTGEIVAIKRIKIEDVDVDHEIMQEVDLLKDMDNPNIVRYLGSVRDESHLNIVLEYIENGSILSTLKAFGSLPEKLVASYTQKILSGLAYLHEHEVAHCDLKAANILTTKTGDVKLTDFGVSLNLRIKQDDMGAPAGTPNWMAPEVIELKGASTKSDIWSLACTIVEMITGKPPYADMIAMSALYHIVEDEEPPIPDHISNPLHDFLNACFQKDPKNRPTAHELIQHHWLTSCSVPPLTPSTSADELTISSNTIKKKSITTLSSSSPKTDDDDIDLSMIYEYMRANPTMDSQRVPAPHIRKREIIEHQFVKSTFGKAIECKVCLVTVKKHAVFCEACALICHEKCRQNAVSCRPIFPSTNPKQPKSSRRDSFPLATSEPRGHNKLQKMLASLYL